MANQNTGIWAYNKGLYEQEFLPKTNISTVALLCPFHTTTSVQSTSNTDKTG